MTIQNPSTTVWNSPPIQAVSGRFFDFDEFAESIGGWDLDWRQLDRGRLDAQILQVATSQATVSRVGFSRRFLQRGSPPADRLTFGLLDAHVGEIDWCRRRARNAHLLVFNPGGEYESLSEPGFSGTTMTYSEEHLDRVAEMLGVSVDLKSTRVGGSILELDSELAARLKRHVHEIENTVGGTATPVDSTRISRRLDDEIPSLLIRALAADRLSPQVVVNGPRKQAAENAREFIDANAGLPPTI